MYNPHFDEKAFRASVESFNLLKPRDIDALMFRIRNLFTSEEQSLPAGLSDFRKTVTKIASDGNRDVKDVILQVLNDPKPLFKHHKIPLPEEKAAPQTGATLALSPYLRLQQNRGQRRTGDRPATLSRNTIEMLAVPAIERMSAADRHKLHVEANAAGSQETTEKPAAVKKRIEVARPPVREISAPAEPAIKKVEAPAPVNIQPAFVEVAQEANAATVTVIATPVEIAPPPAPAPRPKPAQIPKAKAKPKPDAPAREKVAKTEKPSSIKSLFNARDLIQPTAAFVRKNKTIPDPGAFHHFIAGKSVSDLDKAFQKGKISGLDNLLPGSPQPKRFIDFLLATGLVEEKGGARMVAPPSKIDQIVKTLG